MSTLYYDPTLDVHHRLPVRSALTTSFYAAAQKPADARRLFDAAAADMGLGPNMAVPLPATRGTGAALILAKEWGLDDLTHQLEEAIDASYEPTWEPVRGEFTWGFGLGEEHPRGQYNAFLAAAEAAGFGAWERLSAAPLPRSPQIVGVDFPAVALSYARWKGDSLDFTVSPRHSDPSLATAFSIVGAEPGVRWSIEAVGTNTGFEPSIEAQADNVSVTLPLTPATYRVNLTR